MPVRARRCSDPDKADRHRAINTAVKNAKASNAAIKAVTEAMTTSAADASKLMVELGANGCTDITGFGLLGHAYEMANASRRTFEDRFGRSSAVA